MKEITKEKLNKYVNLTEKAIKKVKIVKTGKVDFENAAKDFLDMAQRYYDDANHFMKKGDYVNAFAAINYAHAWLDAGARIGLFDVGHDSELFTVD